MAPLSILPGRVRYADSRLLGNEPLVVHLENSLGLMPGIELVSASHRTGSILVEFNEAAVDRERIAGRISSLLAEAEPVPATMVRAAAAQRTSLTTPGRIIADMALHLILPAPLDLLLPALRRS